MDMIFYNGLVRTLDGVRPLCGGVIVKNGVIAALLSELEAAELAKRLPEARTVDMEGGLLLPGFTDSHLHLLEYGKNKRNVDLSAADSLEALIRLCKDADRGGKGWLLGVGFDHQRWQRKALPTRVELDRISRERPLAVRRVCYHLSVVNSRGVERLMECGAALSEEERSTGLLKEQRQEWISASCGLPAKAELKDLIVSACADAAAKGLTQVHTDDFEAFSGGREAVIAAYRELAQAELLPVRIYQQCLLSTEEKLHSFLEQGYRSGQRTGFYELGPLKLLADGSLGAKTAALRGRYRDGTGRGQLNYEDGQLLALIERAHRAGMQVAIHCIGDAALEQAVGCFEQVMEGFRRANPRHGIVHCQLADAGLRRRMARLSLLAYVQPVFVPSDMELAARCLDEELAAESYNWRGLLDLGVHVSGGSDCPVEPFDVLPNLYYAMTRKNRPGTKVWHGEHCLSAAEAVRMFTWEGAYASFGERRRGSLSPGKEADMVLLDRDILSRECGPEALRDAAVRMTVAGGRIVWDGRAV